MKSHEDDKTQDPGTRSRIDLDEPKHVSYWCARLRCSEGQLRDAVSRVGSTVARVEAFLG